MSSMYYCLTVCRATGEKTQPKNHSTASSKPINIPSSPSKPIDIPSSSSSSRVGASFFGRFIPFGSIPSTSTSVASNQPVSQASSYDEYYDYYI